MANDRAGAEQSIKDLVARAAAITLAIRQHNATGPGAAIIPETAIGSIILADKLEVIWSALDGMDSRLDQIDDRLISIDRTLSSFEGHKR